ncbi:MAG: D-alanine--D-alanine ligase [Lachnospiraceae bacterium]|nr:D-alanine--D-alanine ligase [Lachnospiraceae bacterium]
MKIKVAVLFGGKTTEHEISIISAIQAMGCINGDKYQVIPVYISKDNDMYVGENIGNIEKYKNIPALIKESKKVTFVSEGNKVNIMYVSSKGFSKKVYDTVDVAFPIVHGTNAEDGTLFGYLKMFNLPIVGCDVTSSAVGMDKYVAKTVLKYNDIPVLDCLRVYSWDYNDDNEKMMDNIEAKVSYPMIVKPVNLGSSVGISKAKDRDGLATSLELAFKFADKVIVERAITNLKEINCSVLGDEIHAEASECEEPVSHGDILDYKDKYMGGNGKNGTKGGAKSAGGSKGMASLARKIPADISDDVRAYIREMAVKAFKVLGCNGVSRIDFMIDKDTNEVFLNEINTIPGSLSFYLWEPMGVPYHELLDRMIMLALKRNTREENLIFSFETNVLEGVKLGGSTGAKGSKM